MDSNKQAPGFGSPGTPNDTWVDREPSTVASLPPDNAYTGRFAAGADPSQNPYTQTSQQLVKLTKPKKKHGPPFFVAIFLILIVLGGAGFVGAMYISQSLHPIKKVVTTSTKLPVQTVSRSQQTQVVMQAYTKISDHSLIVMQGTKQIAAQTLPSGKTTFSVISVTDKGLLVLAYAKDATDPAPDGYLVTANGTVTPLTAPVAATVSKFGNNGHLDENNNFLSVTCKDTSCILNSTALTSGAVTPVTTQGFTPSAQGVTSLTLLGISPKNSAFFITYSKNNQADPIGTLSSIDLGSGSVGKSLIMQKAALNPPQFSPDFSHALYTEAQDSSTGQLIGWDGGSTTQVNGTIGNGPSYIWSPDNTQAIFLTSSHDQSSTLGTIAASNGNQTILKTFPTSATTSLTILGWVNSQIIEYQLATTTTPNNFANAQVATHTYNLSTGADQPVSDQTLLPATNSLSSV